MENKLMVRHVEINYLMSKHLYELSPSLIRASKLIESFSFEIKFLIQCNFESVYPKKYFLILLTIITSFFNMSCLLTLISHLMQN